MHGSGPVKPSALTLVKTTSSVCRIELLIYIESLCTLYAALMQIPRLSEWPSVGARSHLCTLFVAAALEVSDGRAFVKAATTRLRLQKMAEATSLPTRCSDDRSR